MPDPTSDTILVGVVVGLTAVAVFEIRYLQLRRKQGVKREEFIPDKAHNALTTTKAIAAALARDGFEDPQAQALLEEAEGEYGRGNYRVAIDILERTRVVLQQARARSVREGDAPKLRAPPPIEGEPLPKEKLTKEVPKDMLQARFSLNRAREVLQTKGGGPEAQLVGKAQAAFDGGDFTTSLRLSHQALKALGMGEAIAPAPFARPLARCLQCGAELQGGNQPCPQCGTLPKASQIPSG